MISDGFGRIVFVAVLVVVAGDIFGNTFQNGFFAVAVVIAADIFGYP